MLTYYQEVSSHRCERLRLVVVRSIPEATFKLGKDHPQLFAFTPHASGGNLHIASTRDPIIQMRARELQMTWEFDLLIPV